MFLEVAAPTAHVLGRDASVADRAAGPLRGQRAVVADADRRQLVDLPTGLPRAQAPVGLLVVEEELRVEPL